MSDYAISQDDDYATAAQIVWDGLADYNRRFAPDDNYRHLRFFVRDAEGKVVGGLLGETYWGWLHIDILWLSQEVRGQDYGTQLMQQAEEIGRERGCRYAFLDTLSFQARPFYEKLGYAVFATQEDYPHGHERYFLKKT